ncbi:MAG: FIST C-terminal domain-containing protein [Chloroflexi bacterium]|nr:FIST C-terminal domain-containing protein [Chloroflexota bacterium]
MRWASAVSDAPSFTEAINNAAEQVLDQLEDRAPDLVLVFVSFHHAPSFYSVNELLRSHFGSAQIIGCSGAGVIGAGTEIERRPGVSITAACLPSVEITPFHVKQDDLPTPDSPPDAWEQLTGVAVKEDPSFLIFTDPFSLETDRLISGLDYAYPNGPKIGGLASGGAQETPHALFMGGRTHREGAVGVALTGNIEIDTVVAQGCRPIGEPMVVTKAEKNVIQQLGTSTPLEILRGLFSQGIEKDRWLMRRALQVGVVMDRFATEFGAGDFLIRNVMGMDEDTGSLIVGDVIQEGQIVQFHLRDAEAAREDLMSVLDRYDQENPEKRPEAALMFSCVSRGQHLFRRPNHDTEIFSEMIASVPLSGFFCNGEIGPVGGTTFLHGYTTSLGLIHSPLPVKP